MEMKGSLFTTGNTESYGSHLTPWCQKTSLINVQCGHEDTEYHFGKAHAKKWVAI
jgi:hypothetical protein